MSLKNKTINSLKYLDWVVISYNDAKGKTFSFSKIDLESLNRLPYTLEYPSYTQTFPPRALISYWFPLECICHMLWNIVWTSQGYLEESLDKPLIEISEKDSLFTTFLKYSVQLWFSLPPLLNDFNILYKKHNKDFSEHDFLLLDFWFHNLSVMDELMQAFEEFNLKLQFFIDPMRESKLFGFSLDDLKLLEPTESNLKILNCADWCKQDFINHIYKQFSKIDMHIFYAWLISRKINNIYKNKEAFVYAYLTNSETGLNSLSLSTLKLLALNPILDFDYMRKLHADRIKLHAEKSAKIDLLPPA